MIGENPAVREGNGFRGMRERIESLGGQFSLERENPLIKTDAREAEAVHSYVSQGE